MQVEESTIFVVRVVHSSHSGVRTGSKRGPLLRFRGLLLLTRWLSVSCSLVTGHIYYYYFFFSLFKPCAGVSSQSFMSPSGQWLCLSPRLQLFLSFLLLFLVMFFFFFNKKREKKSTGKGITICQPAGILYIIYQGKKKKKKNKHENYITQKPDGNDLQILHRLLLKRQIVLLF